MRAIDRDKVLRIASALSQADVSVLASVIAHCGGGAGGAGFKGLLHGTLDKAGDRARANRLQRVVKHLNESELAWLCDNSDALASRVKRR